METIFVSVASYRDANCGATIRSLYEMAAAPERVFVGTCEQNDLTTRDREECVRWDDPMMKNYYKNLRRIQLSSSDAQGPCYARFLCSLLYRDEDYFMQIDSHSLLVKGWDAKCIDMIRRLPPRSILSYYPIPSDKFHPEPPLSTPIPVIRSAFVNPSGLLQWSPGVYTSMDEKPLRVPFIAAGFIFAPGSFVRDVPFDPSLPYLFMGEESLLSIRAFTSGYDVYTPHQSIIYHRYLRSSEPSVYTDHRWSDDAAVRRAARICGLLPGEPPLYTPRPAEMREVDPFGLGHERSPDDFFGMIGVAHASTPSSPKPIVGMGCDRHRSRVVLIAIIILLVIVIIILLLLRR